jgi:hypothetical protein
MRGSQALVLVLPPATWDLHRLLKADAEVML